MSSDEKIRERAYHLWVDEGMPAGREMDHWELAAELVAIEENPDLMLKPNPLQPGEEIYPDEPGESAKLMENLGEFPTLTDQGEEMTSPDPVLAAQAGTATASEGETNASAPTSEGSSVATAKRRSSKAAPK